MGSLNFIIVFKLISFATHILNHPTGQFPPTSRYYTTGCLFFRLLLHNGRIRLPLPVETVSSFLPSSLPLSRFFYIYLFPKTSVPRPATLYLTFLLNQPPCVRSDSVSRGWQRAAHDIHPILPLGQFRNLRKGALPYIDRIKTRIRRLFVDRRCAHPPRLAPFRSEPRKTVGAEVMAGSLYRVRDHPLTSIRARPLHKSTFHFTIPSTGRKKAVSTRPVLFFARERFYAGRGTPRGGFTPSPRYIAHASRSIAQFESITPIHAHRRQI